MPVNTLEIYARGSNGYDAYHGYEASEGSCVGKNKDCYSYTHITDQVHWIQINNAYGLEAPFNPHNNDYYVTDMKKSGEVIRLVATVGSPSSEDYERKIKTFQAMIQTFTFIR